MKLYLPHREVKLDVTLTHEERNEFVFTLLNESTGLTDNEGNVMTVEEYFRFTWEKQNAKVLMDVIAYYLTKSNTDEKEDKAILSNAKQKEMIKGSKRHTTFSGMDYDTQVSIGIALEEDESH